MASQAESDGIEAPASLVISTDDPTGKSSQHEFNVLFLGPAIARVSAPRKHSAETALSMQNARDDVKPFPRILTYQTLAQVRRVPIFVPRPVIASGGSG